MALTVQLLLKMWHLTKLLWYVGVCPNESLNENYHILLLTMHIPHRKKHHLKRLLLHVAITLNLHGVCMYVCSYHIITMAWLASIKPILQQPEIQCFLKMSEVNLSVTNLIGNTGIKIHNAVCDNC